MKRHKYTPLPTRPGCVKCGYGESSPIHTHEDPEPLPDVEQSFATKEDDSERR